MSTGKIRSRSNPRLTAREVNGLRSVLLREKEALTVQYHEDVRSAREIQEEGLEDFEELATMDVDRDLLLTFSELDLEKVTEIDEALRRIEEGTYGLCEAGGEPIPRARLHEIPWARLCVEHQALREEAMPAITVPEEIGLTKNPWEDSR
jgi:DnaK suppressor protein